MYPLTRRQRKRERRPVSRPSRGGSDGLEADHLIRSSHPLPNLGLPVIRSAALAVNRVRRTPAPTGRAGGPPERKPPHGRIHSRDWCRTGRLPRPPASRHRRFPAHDRAAVRWPREVHSRPRRGDDGRQADSARHAEKRLRRRSCLRRHLYGRYARNGAAAPQAARRHREGARRGAPGEPR